MRGTDLLALADSLGRIERECRHARVALNLVLAEQDRDAARIPKISAPDYAALTHTVAIPEDVAEHIEACGE